ncbi:hypothetical protein BDV26DRAFT_130038 [Aspergillus bertholletiae]|uniref:Uncharacterized protein n=1 Tax=Aspergillus bertholletiae TaxID=1226010 RepID=A0A5N7ARM0_9EURO|nr:hypothetical protein BDV26DRAFT_130038 [Aspergillus bertholletiae]
MTTKESVVGYRYSRPYSMKPEQDFCRSQRHQFHRWASSHRCRQLALTHGALWSLLWRMAPQLLSKRTLTGATLKSSMQEALSSPYSKIALQVQLLLTLSQRSIHLKTETTFLKLNGITYSELGQIVMDDQWIQKLQNKLRQATYDCYDCWEELAHELAHQQELTSDFKDHIPKIQRHLLSAKFILADEATPSDSSLIIEEERRMDTLHYAEKQLELIKREKQSGNYVNRADEVLQGLLPLQEKIVALTRLLALPQKVDQELSMRGAGTYASLA